MRFTRLIALVGVVLCAGVAQAENALAVRLRAVEQDLGDLRALIGPQHVWVDQLGVQFAIHPGPLVVRPFDNQEPWRGVEGTAEGVLIHRDGAAPLLFRSPGELAGGQSLFYVGADCTGTAYVSGPAHVIDAVEVVLGYAADGRWATQSGPAELFELVAMLMRADVKSRLDPDGRCVESWPALERVSRAAAFDRAPLFEGPIGPLAEEWR